jgi:RNA polymerase sigma-70 factor (ECF subfamily)
VANADADAPVHGTRPSRVARGAIRASDPEDRSVSWERYRAELNAFVLRRVGNSADAEDIVQDVLVRALAHRDSLRNHAKLRSWLFQITRNAIVDHYRTRRPTEPLPPDLRAEGDDPDRAAVRELSQCLVSMADSLPPLYREALVLSELEGLRQREIADRLGLSLSGAKSRVQRARRILATDLLECCRVELDAAGRIQDYHGRGDCSRCD